MPSSDNFPFGRSTKPKEGFGLVDYAKILGLSRSDNLGELSYDQYVAVLHLKNLEARQSAITFFNQQMDSIEESGVDKEALTEAAKDRWVKASVLAQEAFRVLEDRNLSEMWRETAEKRGIVPSGFTSIPDRPDGRAPATPLDSEGFDVLLQPLPDEEFARKAEQIRAETLKSAAANASSEGAGSAKPAAAASAPSSDDKPASEPKASHAYADRNLYADLGLEVDASSAEIEKAWSTRDANASSAQLSRMTTALTILRDPEDRKVWHAAALAAGTLPAAADKTASAEPAAAEPKPSGSRPSKSFDASVDYYAVLGLKPDATTVDVQHAYATFADAPTGATVDMAFAHDLLVNETCADEYWRAAVAQGTFSASEHSARKSVKQPVTTGGGTPSPADETSRQATDSGPTTGPSNDGAVAAAEPADSKSGATPSDPVASTPAAPIAPAFDKDVDYYAELEMSPADFKRDGFHEAMAEKLAAQELVVAGASDRITASARLTRMTHAVEVLGNDDVRSEYDKARGTKALKTRWKPKFLRRYQESKKATRGAEGLSVDDPTGATSEITERKTAEASPAVREELAAKGAEEAPDAAASAPIDPNAILVEEFNAKVWPKLARELAATDKYLEPSHVPSTSPLAASETHPEDVVGMTADQRKAELDLISRIPGLNRDEVKGVDGKSFAVPGIATLTGAEEDAYHRALTEFLQERGFSEARSKRDELHAKPSYSASAPAHWNWNQSPEEHARAVETNEADAKYLDDRGTPYGPLLESLDATRGAQLDTELYGTTGGRGRERTSTSPRFFYDRIAREERRLAKAENREPRSVIDAMQAGVCVISNERFEKASSLLRTFDNLKQRGLDATHARFQLENGKAIEEAKTTILMPRATAKTISGLARYEESLARPERKDISENVNSAVEALYGSRVWRQAAAQFLYNHQLRDIEGERGMISIPTGRQKGNNKLPNELLVQTFAKAQQSTVRAELKSKSAVSLSEPFVAAVLAGIAQRSAQRGDLLSDIPRNTDLGQNAMSKAFAFRGKTLPAMAQSGSIDYLDRLVLLAVSPAVKKNAYSFDPASARAAAVASGASTAPQGAAAMFDKSGPTLG